MTFPSLTMSFRTLLVDYLLATYVRIANIIGRMAFGGAFMNTALKVLITYISIMN